MRCIYLQKPESFYTNEILPWEQAVKKEAQLPGAFHALTAETRENQLGARGKEFSAEKVFFCKVEPQLYAIKAKTCEPKTPHTPEL